MAKKAARKKPTIQVVEDTPSVVESSPQSEFPFGANEEMAKTATKKTATNKKKTATTGKVSGSQKVRDYYAAHPDAKQSEIAKETGVAQSQVSSVIKALLKKGGKPAKAKGGRPAKAKAAPAESNGHGVSAFVKHAFEIGLDAAIAKLQQVKKAIE